jgi:small nuclear ribonucleoprotein (snRNP)-like protein
MDDALYDKTMNLFLLDLEEMGEILTKLIYDLTGANVEMIQTFDR